MCGEDEDAVSMALTAMHGLLRRCGALPAEVEHLGRDSERQRHCPRWHVWSQEVEEQPRLQEKRERARSRVGHAA